MHHVAETECVDTPTLASFCVWLHKQPMYYMNGTPHLMQNVESALLAVRDFLVSEEGKTPEQARAFTDVCREMAETETKNHEDFIHRQNDVFLATMC